MRLHPLAISLCAAAPALACAQSSLTLSGSLDTSLNATEARTPAGTRVRSRLVAGGLNGQSRWGLRGVEDLGGGYNAQFLLESALQSDSGTGTGFAGGLTFQRRSVVGLGSPWGTLWLGRDYTPGFLAASGADVAAVAGWPYGLYGTTLLNWTADASASRGVRWDNALFYVSPALWGGLVVRAAASLGEGAVPHASWGSNWGLSARYEVGPAYAFAYHHHMKDPAAPTTTRHRGLGGAYHFGRVRVSAAQQEVDPAGAPRFTGRNLGVGVQLGGGWLLGQVHRIRERAAGAEGTTVALSYVYSLSRRTDLIASTGRQRNNALGSFALRAADFQVASPAAGSRITAIGFGVSHKF